MTRLLIPRILTTGSLLGAATALRVGTGCLELLVERTPPLVGLAVRASVGGPDTAKAQATFRDEFVALARESAEVSWRELRRGVDELDAYTRADATSRPDDPTRPDATNRPDDPTRPDATNRPDDPTGPDDPTRPDPSARPDDPPAERPPWRPYRVKP